MGPSGLLYVFLYVLAATCVLQRAAGARTQEPQPLTTLTPTQGSEAISGLNTYYFDALKPQISLSTRSLNRPERTALTVKLISPSSVSAFMPVVNPKPASGMTHSVSRTWQALKNLAVMFGQVNAVNQESPAARRLFPRAFMAVTAASDNAPVKQDLSTTIRMAEARGLRSAWAGAGATSVLMVPFGQSTGAVADVMDVTYNEQADEISIELDVVHHPYTISEFESHGIQSLDVEKAHYHFYTAPSIKVDAQALLQDLKAPNTAVQGMHMFVKGVNGRQYINFPAECSLLTLSASKTQAVVGDLVEVTVEFTGFDADCVCQEEGCCTDDVSSPSPRVCLYGCYFGDCCATDPCCRDASGDPRSSDCKDDNKKKMDNEKTPNLGAQQAALSAKGGSKSHVTPPAAAKKHTKRTGQRRREGEVKSIFDCRDIRLRVTSNAEWVAEGVPPGGEGYCDGDCNAFCLRQQQAASNGTAGSRQPGALQPASFTASFLEVRTGAGGVATALLKITEPGLVTVGVDEVDFGNLDTALTTITITATRGTAGSVKKLKLLPDKTHSHCGEPATFTTIAKDANGSPVANANVAFSADGDCQISNSPAVKTTDANGVATYTIGSYEPCKASVVAASVSASGAAVVSDVSHVYFVDGHYPEEGEYYKGGHPRYAEERLQ